MTNNKYVNLKILVIFCLLIAFTCQQRGGGRSGGSRSSSRSSGFGRRHYSGSGGNCDANCQRTVGFIFFGVIGAFIVGCCTCQCCRFYNRQKQRRKTLQQYRQKYNLSRSPMVSQEEYKAIFNSFLGLLQEVKSKVKSFVYLQEGLPKYIQLESVTSQPLDNSSSQIKIKGRDEIGSWEGQGGFILTGRGPLFWMLKWYDNQQEAGQTGAWQTLIYESSRISYGQAEGRWFYEGQEMINAFSGGWQIGHQLQLFQQ